MCPSDRYSAMNSQYSAWSLWLDWNLASIWRNMRSWDEMIQYPTEVDWPAARWIYEQISDDYGRNNNKQSDSDSALKHILIEVEAKQILIKGLDSLVEWHIWQWLAHVWSAFWENFAVFEAERFCRYRDSHLDSTKITSGVNVGSSCRWVTEFYEWDLWSNDGQYNSW